MSEKKDSVLGVNLMILPPYCNIIYDDKSNDSVDSPVTVMCKLLEYNSSKIVVTALSTIITFSG